MGEQQHLDAHVPLLDILRKEYDYEAERKKQFENKAGGFIGFTLAIITFFLSLKMEVFKRSLHAIQQDVYSYAGVWAILHMIVFLFGIFFVLRGMYYFLKVYSHFKQYEHLPIGGLIDLAIRDRCALQFNMHVAILIEKVMKCNQELIDEKSRDLTKGIFWLIAGVVGLLMWNIVCFLAGF